MPAPEFPMYQLFHSGKASPDVRKLQLEDDDDWGVTRKDGAYISQLAKVLRQMTREDRNLLFAVARKRESLTATERGPTMKIRPATSKGEPHDKSSEVRRCRSRMQRRN